MTVQSKRNLPSLIWCPYHKRVIRGCVHRDKGLLDIDLSKYDTAHLLTPELYSKIKGLITD